ncbi:tetratricopeptide repeat protein [Opitutus terrae]|uniref:TPR repeat-containing protein n=1 Tax=Opitutus terrae (strain DSM 11246 / JCM 15787 / PB90-1) TaxID=452637 RepID=B1ZRT5_OPITP|nr:tetratricopeptide repeat protein [Opitutus terrae]ACB73778.1 TPR repeat-containing protein [Opitutus terrae PB90-1]
MKTKLWIVFAVLLLAGLGVGGWWWVRAGAEQAVVATALPALPDLTNVLDPLRERIASADARATSRFSARTGLAELSRLYHANGFLEEAMRCYDGLEQLEPNEPRWPHLHATIVAGYGEVDRALTLWRRVEALAPDYIPARLRIADCELKADRPTKAAAEYAEVRKIRPDDRYALLGLARIDYDASRWEQAREKLEALVAQTNFELGYDLIVSVYEKLGQHERAESIRGAAKAFGTYRDPPDPWVDELMAECYDPYRLSLTAGVLARSGGQDKALQLLERAVELAPADISSRFQLGNLHVEMGNFSAGREALETCTRLAPEFSDGWARLSALQAQLGEMSAAERTLATGLQNCPQSPALHLMRARNLRQAGRTDEAINEYMISIRLRPNEPEPYMELGNTLIAAGREEEGVEQIRAALVAEPADPMALSVLAFRAIQLRDEAEAQQWMTRVENQPRVKPEQRQHLRDLYRQQFGHDFPSRGQAANR